MFKQYKPKAIKKDDSCSSQPDYSAELLLAQKEVIRLLYLVEKLESQKKPIKENIYNAILLSGSSQPSDIVMLPTPPPLERSCTDPEVREKHCKAKS